MGREIPVATFRVWAGSTESEVETRRRWRRRGETDEVREGRERLGARELSWAGSPCVQ
jgi:hypothetical protein